MTAERQPPGSRSPRPDLEAANASLRDADTGDEDRDGYEDDELYEDDDELDDDADAEARAPERRGWPLGTMFVLAIGIWAGRWFSRLPDGLEDTLGLLLIVLTALLGAGLYRRWVRRQLAEARARRLNR